MLSAVVYRHMKRPSHFGLLADADVIGVQGRPDQVGPFFHLYLKISGARITDASFLSHRCPWLMAVGSVLTVRLLDRCVEDASGLRAADLLQDLGEVPEEKVDRVVTALNAWHDARAKYLDRSASRPA